MVPTTALAPLLLFGVAQAAIVDIGGCELRRITLPDGTPALNSSCPLEAISVRMMAIESRLSAIELVIANQFAPSPPPPAPPTNPPPSTPMQPTCNGYYQADASASSGTYRLSLPGFPEGTDVACHMTSGGAWTQVAKTSPTYSDPGWTGSYTPGSAFTPAFYTIADFSEMLIGDDPSSGQVYSISACNSGRDKTLRDLVAGGGTCGSLDFEDHRTYQSCLLRVRIETGSFHTWDGGVSGSFTGVGKNGYKTNNGVNCGKSCVTDCSMNNGNQAGSSATQIWVR